MVRERSTSRAKTVIPQEKFDISGIVVIFSPNALCLHRRIQAAYSTKSLQYLVAFKNYNYLNLNVHFSK